MKKMFSFIKTEEAVFKGLGWLSLTFFWQQVSFELRYFKPFKIVIFRQKPEKCQSFEGYMYFGKENERIVFWERKWENNKNTKSHHENNTKLTKEEKTQQKACHSFLLSSSTNTKNNKKLESLENNFFK